MTSVARAPSHDDRRWHGAYAPYDLVKEPAIALGVMTALALAHDPLLVAGRDHLERRR
jgi:hypothetical protein